MVSELLESATAETALADDPFLPQRDLVLDDHFMAGALGSALDRQIDRCTRVRTKYRVGQSLRVTLDVRSGSVQQLFSLRCFPEASPQLAAGPGPGGFELAGLGAHVWAFPADRKLKQISTFWKDPARRMAALGQPCDALEIVSYAPEKCVTIRCGSPERPIGFAKLYGPDAYRYSVVKYDALSSALGEQGIDAPRPVRSDDHLHMVLISVVAGDTLALRQDPADWHKLGEVMARFHATPVPTTLPNFERTGLPRLRTAAALIALARPDVASTVSELIAVLEDTESVVGGPDFLLHGDLHAKNVLVNGSDLGFIDLDQAGRGPAAAELGSAIAALRCDMSATVEARTVAEHNLRVGYGSDVVTEPDLAWHIAAALLGERALRAVNRVRLDGLQQLPQILRSAVETIEVAR